MLRQPGHRFFFAPEEVEPIEPREAASQHPAELQKILIAGIGNIFLGDDGFGVEVARRSRKASFRKASRVRDFGIRGYDLAYALLDRYDSPSWWTQLRAAPPGTLYVIEPDLNHATAEPEGAALDAHAMNPVERPTAREKHGAGFRHSLAGRL